MRKLVALLAVLLMGATPYNNLPLNMPGLTAWYDFSNASTVTVSGGKISQVTDLSGSGNTLTQATSANQPTYTATVNGLNVATFTTTSSQVLSSSTTNTFATGSNPSAMFTVGYYTGAASAYNGYAGYGSTATDGQRILGSRGTAVYYSSGSVSFYNTTNWGSTQLTIVSAIYGSTSTLAVNGSVLNSVAATLATPTGTSFYLGFYPTSSNYWTGVIGETVVVNGAITTANQQLIEGYLACKWGLQANLPATHPYRNNCPYYPNPAFMGTS